MTKLSKSWSNEQQLYWAKHQELIKLLGHIIGIELPSSSRLKLFWLRMRLGTVYKDVDPNLIGTVVGLIDQLVEQRTWGWEPPHANGKYIEGGTSGDKDC